MAGRDEVATRKQLLEFAQAQERRGQLDSAAGAYARAGSAEDAARLYVAAGKFLDAAKVLLASIGWAGRQRPSTLDAEKRKTGLKAAICFGRGGDVRQAVELYQILGERARAVELLRSVGDHANAARVEHAQTGVVELVAQGETTASMKAHGAAPDATGSNLRGAQALEAAGKLESALEAYVHIKQYGNAARMAQQLGRIPEAATYYHQSGAVVESGFCFRQAGDTAQALQMLVKAPRDHARFREACVLAVVCAEELNRMDLEVDNLLARFVATGPQDDREAEAFYRLGGLYEKHALPDNARECYRKLLGKKPGYKDVPQRLKGLDAESRGSTKAIEQIYQEEVSFRDAVARHETPPPAALGSEQEDGLPELPDLPDLPDLPSVPHAQGRAGTIARAGRALTPAPVTPAPVVQPVSPTGEFSTGAAALVEGAVVNNRYRLEKKIGQGGMGAVYRAMDLELEETVAIKFLSVTAADETLLQRFKQEVTLSRQFNHPNIIRMYDLGTWGEHKYISMELLSGGDLSHVMDGKPMDLVKGLAYFEQACTALQIVHDRNIVHRDIKPENFFVTSDDVVKVMDFGIAKRHNSGKGLTRAGMMAGTPQYMAPEQINDLGSVNHLADIYSMGIICYQMFTGICPFDGDELMPILLAHMTQEAERPRTKNAKIPVELDNYVMKLMAKNATDRPQSCKEVAAEIARIRGALK